MLLRSHRPTSGSGVLERWYLAQPVPRVAGAAVRGLPRLDMHVHTAALRQLLGRHPALQRALPTTLSSGLGSVPQGTPLPISRSPHADPLQELAHLIHAPFVQGQHLFRISVCGDTSLAVAVHHALADGLSVALLVRDYLQALDSSAPRPQVPLAATPLEDHITLPHPLHAWLPQALKRSLRRPFPVYLGPEGPAVPLTTQLCATTLNAEQVAPLQARSRAERTTVHGALCAAALKAASPAAHPPDLAMRLSTPVSLRKRCSPQPESIGLYLCGVDTAHRVGPATSFWDLARECTDAVQKGVRPAMGELRLLRAFGDLTSIAAGRGKEHPQRRTATVEVSNLGLCDVGQARVHFAQGNHYHGPLYNLSVLTSRATSEMSITLSTPHPYVAQSDARAYLDRVESQLECAIRPPTR